MNFNDSLYIEAKSQNVSPARQEIAIEDKIIVSFITLSGLSINIFPMRAIPHRSIAQAIILNVLTSRFICVV